MYTPKYPAVAQGGLACRELDIVYIYSEYPAVGSAWKTVEEGWITGEKVGKRVGKPR